MKTRHEQGLEAAAKKLWEKTGMTLSNKSIEPIIKAYTEVLGIQLPPQKYTVNQELIDLLKWANGYLNDNPKKSVRKLQKDIQAAITKAEAELNKG